VNGSDCSHLPSIILHHQYLGVPANDIPVFLTSCSVNFSTCSHSYSLRAVWICKWKDSNSDIFSRWISRHILSISYDKIYSKSHSTHQSHISGPLETPPPPLALAWDATPLRLAHHNPPRCTSASIHSLLYSSAVKSFSFSAPP